MVLMVRQHHILWIMLFVILLLAAPIITLILAIILFLYLYLSRESNNMINVINIFERFNVTKALIACGLTLASSIIYQSANYETRFGFPSPFIFYYNFPRSDEVNVIWNNVYSKLAVHLLNGIVDVVIYYITLSAIYWLYRKVTGWIAERNQNIH